MKISIDDLQSMCCTILIKNGLKKNEAEVIVEDYIDAEARGKISHGISAFAIVANDAKNRGKYKIKSQKGVVTLIEGNGDIGHIVARKAMNYPGASPEVSNRVI